MAKFFKKIKQNIRAFQKKIGQNSRDVLFNFYLIMFSLFATSSIERAMDLLVGQGVLVLDLSNIFLGIWKIFSMVFAAFTICIFFVHGSKSVFDLKFDNNLVLSYIKTFYVLYLSLAPWMSLHLARLIAAVFVTGIPDINADYIFSGMYASGYLFLVLVIWIFSRKKKNKNTREKIDDPHNG